MYDLALGGGLQACPDAALGRAACENASNVAIEQGNVGVGAGCLVGKWAGIDKAMRGGFGV